MKLNTDNRVLLGICGGIAEWLGLPAALLRLIFLVCTLVWPLLALAYLLVYMCLDRKPSDGRFKGYFADSGIVGHFRNVDYRKPIRKNRREGWLAGVCAGLADYFEIRPAMVRLLTLLGLLLCGPFTVLAYLVCLFIFDSDPELSRV